MTSAEENTSHIEENEYKANVSSLSEFLVLARDLLRSSDIDLLELISIS